MNFLILGDGPDERGWAETIANRPGHRVVAAMPGLPDLFPDLPAPGDLEAALAVAGLDAAVVGGPIDGRDEALRRVAASGLAAICLHPPRDNADPYYQVALSREETGAVVVPDLPGRLHPGVARLRDSLAAVPARALRIEAPAEPDDRDLLDTFARWADLARALVGEAESLTSLGDPPGASPSRALTVQVRGPGGRSAEVRLSAHHDGIPARLTLEGERGTLTLDVASDWRGPSRLTRTEATGTTSEEIPDWDPRAAVLDALERAVTGEPARPDLVDGTRAMELRSAAARSLRRGRSVDLHYEEVSEANTFKTKMTSLGCMVLLGSLLALPVALAGPALGFGQTIYIAYVIPPALALFACLQGLGLAMKASRSAGRTAEDSAT